MYKLFQLYIFLSTMRMPLAYYNTVGGFEKFFSDLVPFPCAVCHKTFIIRSEHFQNQDRSVRYMLYVFFKAKHLICLECRDENNNMFLSGYKFRFRNHRYF